MSELSILRVRDPVDSLSAESRFLDAMLAEQAGRVFSRVEWHNSPAQVPARPGHVLVVAANLLIGAASLAVMRAEEALAVAPRQYLPESDHPIYTLSDYERAEARCLAQGDAAPAVSPLPVCLLDRQRFRWNDWPPLTARGVYLQMADYYGSTREDIVASIPAGTRTILEIGCGKGATAAMLRDRLGCRVTGVELNPEVARIAAPRMERMIVGDFLEVDVPGHYDLLLATDVFEHILPCVAFLRKAERLADRILLSIPNVGHYSVVRALLEGRWDYVPAGLLCYTHMRFYTRNSLETLLRQAGYPRFTITPDRGELPDWAAQLPPELAVDRDSLATRGFYVLIQC